MNQLKQHLNDSLQGLEMTPAMEAEILMNLEKPARTSRSRGRLAVAALLVVCTVGVTAVAAVVSTGWKWNPADPQNGLMTPSTYQGLPQKTLDYLEGLIAAKQREVGFGTFEEFEETMGFSLLRAEGMRLIDARVDKTEPKPLIDVQVSGLDLSSAKISAQYSGDIRDAKGNRWGRLIVMPAVADLSTEPQAIPFEYDEETMGGAILSRYEIQTLGVTADLISWPDSMTVNAHFTYNGVTYRMIVTSGGRVAYPPAAVSRACALLELLHD